MYCWYVAFLNPYRHITMYITISCAVFVSVGSAERFLLNERQLLDVALNSSSQISTTADPLLKSSSVKAWCWSSTGCVQPTLPICVNRVCTACSTDRQCKAKRGAGPFCIAGGTCSNSCSLDAQCAATKKPTAPFCTSGVCVQTVTRSPDSSLATVSSNRQY